MHIMKLDKITIRKVRLTDFVMKPEETWLDIDILPPEDKAAQEFIVNTKTLKRFYGIFLKEDTHNWAMDNKGDIYTEVLAWRKH